MAVERPESKKSNPYFLELIGLGIRACDNYFVPPPF